MKTIESIYRYGQFYDKKTGKRIIPKEGSEVVLTFGNEHGILNHDPIYELADPLPSDKMQKRVSIYCEKKEYQFKQLLTAGELLYFAISTNIKSGDQIERLQVQFQSRLLEDLYLIIQAEEKSELFPSRCQLNAELTGHLQFFEHIQAESLNQLYMRTFVLYFNRFGAGTCNAFDKFKTKNGYPLNFLREQAIGW